MTLQFTTIAFILISLAFFHIAPVAFRKYILLVISVFFIYTEGGISSLAVLLAITTVTWLLGLAYIRGSSNKVLTILSIAALAIVLFGWKYIPWLMLQTGSEKSFPAAPIGLSFYTFQAISYIADLYTGKIIAEKNFFKYALYMMWFPKWMSGPIERAGDFIDQIDKCQKTRLLDFKRFKKATAYLIWGMFMKLVIADRIAIVVDSVFDDIPAYGFITVMLASLFYTLQIYCDFAGYTNSMIGISTMFGLELTQNFRTPYFSESTVEFWRKWHISLSNSLKDYIYIPLGGNRKGEFRKMLNTLAVFFVCGIWHGAGLSFIVWGLMHGFFNIITNLIKDTKAGFLVKGITGKIVTFCLVSFAWIFFRAENTTQALEFIRAMIPAMNSNPLLSGLVAGSAVMLELNAIDWCIVGFCVLVLALMDYSAYRKGTTPPAMLIAGMSSNRRIIILSVVLSAVLVFGEYGSGASIREFVYMNF